MTNFEKVTKSSEALAKFIDEAIDEVLDGDCPYVRRTCCLEHTGCMECIKKWLNEEAEEDEE